MGCATSVAATTPDAGRRHGSGCSGAAGDSRGGELWAGDEVPACCSGLHRSATSSALGVYALTGQTTRPLRHAVRAAVSSVPSAASILVACSYLGTTVTEHLQDRRRSCSALRRRHPLLGVDRGWPTVCAAGDTKTYGFRATPTTSEGGRTRDKYGGAVILALLALASSTRRRGALGVCRNGRAPARTGTGTRRRRAPRSTRRGSRTRRRPRAAASTRGCRPRMRRRRSSSSASVGWSAGPLAVRGVLRELVPRGRCRNQARASWTVVARERPALEGHLVGRRDVEMGGKPCALGCRAPCRPARAAPRGPRASTTASRRPASASISVVESDARARRRRTRCDSPCSRRCRRERRAPAGSGRRRRRTRTTYRPAWLVVGRSGSWLVLMRSRVGTDSALRSRSSTVPRPTSRAVRSAATSVLRGVEQ